MTGPVNSPPVRYVEASDGAWIAYQVFGGGRLDLVWMPGQVSHIDVNWELPSYAEFLRTLGGFARVIMIDRRGMGLSDRLSPKDHPPAEVLADDLGAVLEATMSRNTVLFGADEGGQICSLYAATYPDRISGLILYGMTPKLTEGETAEAMSWEEWFRLAIPHWGSREAALLDTREMAPTTAHREVEVAWAAKLQRNGLSPGAVEPLFRTYMALDVSDVLSSIAAPTLVIHRHGDTSIAVETGQAVAEAIPNALFRALPGEDHLPFMGPWELVTDSVAAFLAELKGGPPAQTRRLATVLFTDIVGSTELAIELGDERWRSVISEHHSIARTQVEKAGGVYIDSTGDGLVATFSGPARAVRCAQSLSEALRPLRLAIRAGIHTGEIETQGSDIAGVGVHLAARVAALAGAEEVLVTSTVKELTGGSDLTFTDAGVHELKGFREKWHLYHVRVDPP